MNHFVLKSIASSAKWNENCLDSSHFRTNHFDIFLRFICMFSFAFPNWSWIFSFSSRVLPLYFVALKRQAFAKHTSKCWTSCFVCACRASMNVEPNVCAITRTRAFFRFWFLVVFPFFFLLSFDLNTVSMLYVNTNRPRSSDRENNEREKSQRRRKRRRRGR